MSGERIERRLATDIAGYSRLRHDASKAPELQIVRTSGMLKPGQRIARVVE